MFRQLTLLVLLLAQPVHADQLTSFNQQSSQAIKEFATSLKASLVDAMKSGGPVEAITVCNQVAPNIARQLSEKYQLDISRTSLKVRNPDNRADDWQTAVLNQFEQRKQDGETIKSIHFSDVVESDGMQQLRMMKAIPTSQVCLTCHGDNIKSEVQAMLKQYYPQDQATGFKLDDIRGAFSVSKTLK